MYAMANYDYASCLKPCVQAGGFALDLYFPMVPGTLMPIVVDSLG